MSNEESHDQHGRQGHSADPDPRYGGWEPTPQSGEYDVDATAFVQLPPEDLAGVPLAAPGQGYVPPMIMPLTPAAGLDPAATGSWVVQTPTQQQDRTERHAQEAAPGAVHWPDPNGQGEYARPYQDAAHAAAQWGFTEPAGERTAPETGDAPVDHSAPGDHRDRADYTGQAGHPDLGGRTGPAGHDGRGDHDAPGDYAGPSGPSGHTGHADVSDLSGHTRQDGPSEPSGHTGQWTIPVADGDLPDESGEFLASSAASQQWCADSARPATLPGGAPAPWATQPLPEEPPGPELPAPGTPGPDEEHAAGHPAAAPETAHPLPGAEPEAADRPRAAPRAEPEPEAQADPEQTPQTGPGTAPEAEPVTEPGVEPAQGPPPEPAHGPAPEPAQDPAPEPAPDPEGTAAAAPAPDAGPEAAPEAEPEPDPAHDPAHDPAAAPVDAPSEHPAASYLLHVNGVDRPVSDAWIGESLLYVLRERLGLAGAKDGCSQGECGACNVQVDGRLVASCLVPAATAAGSEVRTVEGLAVDGEPSDVQRALAACGAVQCGFCIPGMAMTVHDLLEGNHAPSELETRQALCGNLCRCSGYRGVLDAVADVVAAREASAEAAASAAQDEARVPHQAEPGADAAQHRPHEGGAQ